MAFIDELLSRRANFHDKVEKGAAQAMQKELSRILDEARDDLKELEKQHAKSGKFIQTPQALKDARKKIAELEITIDDVCGKAANKLIGARQTAYKQGIADIQYSIDTAAGEVDLKIDTSFDAVFTKAAKKAANSPVLGIVPKNAFKGVSAWTKKEVSRTITNAVLNGESIQKTAKKLEKINGVTSRAATRIARTNLNAAMNEAHIDTIEENADIFSGYKWNAIFDERTSQICATLHGRFFKIGSTPPGPPAHPNCRSTLVPVFKDKEMQDFLDGGNKRVRNIRADGERSKTTVVISNTDKYEDWLYKQSPAASVRVTGSKIKDSLWRDGHIEFDELVAPDLTVRSDAELVQRALSRDPKDADLQALAASLGVNPVKVSTIVKRDRALLKKQKHDQGKRI